ncbi:42635_t:CDS:2, partial [Gigaspora margarita]
SAAYHWVTGTILFSATTSLWFANRDTKKLNQEYYNNAYCVPKLRYNIRMMMKIHRKHQNINDDRSSLHTPE